MSNQSTIVYQEPSSNPFNGKAALTVIWQTPAGHFYAADGVDESLLSEDELKDYRAFEAELEAEAKAIEAAGFDDGCEGLVLWSSVEDALAWARLQDGHNFAMDEAHAMGAPSECYGLISEGFDKQIEEMLKKSVK